VLLEIYRIATKNLWWCTLRQFNPDQVSGESYYLVVSDDFEAQVLAGCDDINSAIQELHRHGVQNVIIKQAHRSLLFSGTRVRNLPIPPAPFIQDAGSAA